jgi:hypothetical protein
MEGEYHGRFALSSGFSLTLFSSIVIVWDIDHTALSLSGKPFIWGFLTRVPSEAYAETPYAARRLECLCKKEGEGECPSLNSDVLNAETYLKNYLSVPAKKWI